MVHTPRVHEPASIHHCQRQTSSGHLCSSSVHPDDTWTTPRQDGPNHLGTCVTGKISSVIDVWVYSCDAEQVSASLSRAAALVARPRCCTRRQASLITSEHADGGESSLQCTAHKHSQIDGMPVWAAALVARQLSAPLLFCCCALLLPCSLLCSAMLCSAALTLCSLLFEQSR